MLSLEASGSNNPTILPKIYITICITNFDWMHTKHEFEGLKAKSMLRSSSIALLLHQRLHQAGGWVWDIYCHWYSNQILLQQRQYWRWPELARSVCFTNNLPRERDWQQWFPFNNHHQQPAELVELGRAHNGGSEKSSPSSETPTKRHHRGGLQQLL